MKLIKTMVALGILASSGAMATTTPSSDVNISATVISACSISTAPTAMAFGSYNVYATTATTGTSTFGVKCTAGAAYTMKLAGTIASGVRTFTTTPTGPVGSSNQLKYSLTSGSATGTLWGDGTNGANGVTRTSTTAVEQIYTIYGSIAPGQDVTMGNYSATVALTIDY